MRLRAGWACRLQQALQMLMGAACLHRATCDLLAACGWYHGLACSMAQAMSGFTLRRMALDCNCLVCCCAVLCCPAGATLPRAGVHHPLWSHSYLGYGFDVVQAQVNTLVKQLALDAGSAATPLPPAQVAAALAAGLDNSTAAGQPDAASGSGTPGSLQHSQVPAVHVGEDGVVDPCLPAGYHSADGRVGSGVWQQCQQLVEAVIDPATCRPRRETPCPELPDNMPQLSGEHSSTRTAAGRRCVCCAQASLCC